MTQKCKCCSHPQREEIENMIVDGIPNRRIAAHFSLKEQSVRRHKSNCIPDQIQKSTQLRDLAHADALGGRVSRLLEEAETLLEKFKQKGDLRGAVSSLGEFRRITEMLAKLGADLAENQEINIHKDPGWIEIRTVILRSLEGYPDAHDAVVSALEGIIND